MASIKDYVTWPVPDIKVDINGNENIYYENNQNLRAAGVSLPYTEKHLKEFQRCFKDVYHFAENYYHIRTLDHGIVKIKLRDYQKRMLDSFIGNRNTIVNATRQCGKSTSFEIFVTWYILFHEHKSVAILANKERSATGILRKIKMAYENLPIWLQSGVKTWNSNEIILENGCSVLAAATSSSAIRSASINVLIIDECAFIPTNLWEDFYTSVYPTVSSSKTSKTIMVSTPNGLNHFWRFWKGAKETDPAKKNTFNPIEIHWSEVPGRDQKWYEDTIANMTEQEFAQEFGGSFLGSAYTLINAKTIENMNFEKPLKHTELHELLGNIPSNSLRIYKKPKKKHQYIMSVDSAKVHENSVGDSVAIQVIDITKLPYEQVCVFQNTNDLHYLQIPEIAYSIGKWYNWAYAFIENNELGQQIADTIAFEFEYEKVFFEKPLVAGYRTTTKTKSLGCRNLKGFIENNKLLIHDAETISELSMFTKKKNGTYSAEVGYPDDLVMALIGCLFFITRPEFDAFTDRKELAKQLFSEERKREIEHEIEESVPAFGVVDDGMNETLDMEFNNFNDMF